MVLYPTRAQDGQAVYKEGPAEPGMLRARRHSAAAGGHVLLPTQDLSPALPYHTAPCPPALCAGRSRWHFLNAVPEGRCWGSCTQLPTHAFRSQTLHRTPATCKAPLSLHKEAVEPPSQAQPGSAHSVAADPMWGRSAVPAPGSPHVQNGNYRGLQPTRL